MVSLIFIILVSYLAGSIPFSVIVSRIARNIDIRDFGSGNAGLTNVVRILGLKWGIIVFFGDLLKGYVPAVYVSQVRFDQLNIDPVAVSLIAGGCAVIGHIWPVYISFRGGKGVLTIAGMMLGVAPAVTGTCLFVFIIIFAITRYVSLGSISVGILFPLIIIFKKTILNIYVSPYLTGFSAVCGILIIITHRSNIKRLLSGTENKFTNIKI